MVGHEGQEE